MGQRPLSRREQEERRKKEEEQAAASVCSKRTVKLDGSIRFNFIRHYIFSPL